MDNLVLSTQKWLNKTYSGKSGYSKITEDGITGWGTMRALIKALQIELGTSVDGDFGPSTASVFKNLSTSSSNSNIIGILQGGLFCKGYSAGSLDCNFGPSTESAVKQLQSDAGLKSTGIVNSLLMKAILTMDAFVLLTYGEYYGDSSIRTIQQNLNSKYSSNETFARKIGLVPCDGIYARTTNKALLLAFQIEEGLTGTDLDGIWGGTTKKLAPTLSTGNTKTNFIYLLQYALYCNGFDPNGFDGGYGNGVKNAVSNFQKFCALAADGVCGPQTWASLLVSTGDSSRRGTMCDCSTTITAAKARTLVNNGYKSVGRYLTGIYKMTSSELATIFSAGLKVFPIYETGGYKLSYFTALQGNKDAKRAIQTASSFGFDSGTIIYFCVDYDALDTDITNAILPYFSEIHNVFLRTGTTYKIGIYAPRHVCSRVSEAGYSCSSFICDMSSGFSGNLGYSLPSDWAIDQISTISLGNGDGAIEIDNNISSGKYMGVSKVNPGNNAAGIIDTYPEPSSDSSSSSKPPSGSYNYERIVISGYEGDENSNPQRYHFNFIESALKKIHDILNWKKSLPNNSPYLNDTITWLIDSSSYTANEKNNFNTVVANLSNVKIIYINNKNEIINYLNTSSVSGNGTRSRIIVSLTWFGHGYANIESDSGTIGESTPFLALGKDFHTNLNHRFQLKDIDKLNASKFNLNYLISPSGYKSEFYTCNTGTNDKNSFGYHWYAHLNASIKCCVYRTSYYNIMYSKGYNLSEHVKVKNLREKYGFSENGCIRYPIPYENDNAYWVYWR